MRCPHCGEDITAVYLDPAYFTASAQSSRPGTPEYLAGAWVEGRQRCPACGHIWKVEDNGP